MILSKYYIKYDMENKEKYQLRWFDAWISAFMY